jgi:multisubunit Na+/H+ antiporter MnhB subunit
MKNRRRGHRILHGIVVMALFFLALVLARVVWEASTESTGLSGDVQRAMPRSGVLHPLTAVLLNFRGYDTLLEVGVLLVAVMAVWSLDRQPFRRFQRQRSAPMNPVLRVSLGILVPVTALLAGYMVWVGAFRPGGAFQSGAILSAVAVTLVSSGLLVAPFARSGGVRMMLSIGFTFFLGVALTLGLFRGSLLWYPVSSAGVIILIIEVLLSLSIATALAVLFAAVAGLPDSKSEPAGEKPS